MIDMRVRQQDVAQGDALARGVSQQRRDLVTRIDEHAFTRPRTRHHETILEERSHRLRLDYDHLVILAILDDLLFTSKIKTTGKQMGVSISVARSREAALAEMRAHRPSLVIFDLNNPR